MTWARTCSQCSAHRSAWRRGERSTALPLPGMSRKSSPRQVWVAHRILGIFGSRAPRAPERRARPAPTNLIPPLTHGPRGWGDPGRRGAHRGVWNVGWRQTDSPARIPAPSTISLYATWNCTAMNAPEESPDAPWTHSTYSGVSAGRVWAPCGLNRSTHPFTRTHDDTAFSRLRLLPTHAQPAAAREGGGRGALTAHSHGHTDVVRPQLGVIRDGGGEAEGKNCCTKHGGCVCWTLGGTLGRFTFC